MSVGGGSQEEDSKADCTIIIATLALRERFATLERAIASIRSGNRAAIHTLVVVNGTRFDAALVDRLRSRPDVRVVQITPSSLSAALHAGRLEVTTKYFGFLDDDDEYLPGAVDARISALGAAPRAGLVATNGYRHLDGVDRLAMNCLPEVPADPLRALFTENWLASCGGLFRSDVIGVEFFAEIARYLEWTWLAFRIASAGHQVVVLEGPSFRIHDTAGSESKSEAYLLAHAAIYARMLQAATRRDIQDLLRSRLSQAWHDASVHYLHAQQLSAAWRAHLKSIFHGSGWKYLTYTRRLVSLRRLTIGR
jgi:glycosyltransferase involved in cell wall biosynthesis